MTRFVLYQISSVEHFDDRMLAENRAIEALEHDAAAVLYHLKNDVWYWYDVVSNRWAIATRGGIPESVLAA